MQKKMKTAITARGKTMDKIMKTFAIGLVTLIILAPLGLLAVGETFGEWGTEEIKEKVGFLCH
jgi:cobalt/nickel transport system permease protein/cobalt/nickel transport protein